MLKWLPFRLSGDCFFVVTSGVRSSWNAATAAHRSVEKIVQIQFIARNALEP
jgi:hypothetical protein